MRVNNEQGYHGQKSTTRQFPVKIRDVPLLLVETITILLASMYAQ